MVRCAAMPSLLVSTRMAKSIAFWCAALALSFFVMVQPSHAGTVQNLWRADWDNTGNWYPSASAACAAGIVERNKVNTMQYASCGLGTTTNVSNGVDTQCIGGENMTCTVTGPVALAHQRGVCPSGETKSGTFPNEVCSPPTCAAGTVYRSGMFDIGADPNRVQPGIFNGCGPNNCETVLGQMDDISKKGKVGGVYHYYATGVIVFSGQTCQAGAPSAPTTADPNTPQTCAAGQVAVTSTSGKLNCYNDTGIMAGSNGASSVPSTTTSTSTGTTTTTDASGASSVSQTTTTTTTTTEGGGGGGAAAAATDPQAAYCKENPKALLCTSEQPKADISAASAPAFYDGKLNGDTPKTVSDVVGNFKARVLAAPLGTAVGGFFTVNVVAGACPVWSTDVPMFGAFTFDFYCRDIFQNLLPWIKGVILLIMSVVAFRIAVL